MSDSYSSTIPLLDLPLWEKAKAARTLLSFTLEITARCNNDCPHCYINRAMNDIGAKRDELSFEQIKKIADDAVSLGAFWCLISGGEPLLREDFFDIYLYLKQKGLLVSVFTNAVLITDEHIEFFKKYQPRDIEVTVYGVTEHTYAQVTKRPGNFKKFMAGIHKLSEAGLPLTLKSTITQSNYKELKEIKSFAEEISKKPFRFDPFLQLRNDRDALRNDGIRSQRLSVEEIISIEHGDDNRISALKKRCRQGHDSQNPKSQAERLFKCGVGLSECCISPEGMFKLCTALCASEFVADLKKSSLAEAWKVIAPKIRETKSQKRAYIDTCGKCSLMDFCMHCPAHTDLETNEVDGFVDYFCRLAKERYARLA